LFRDQVTRAGVACYGDVGDQDVDPLITQSGALSGRFTTPCCHATEWAVQIKAAGAVVQRR
jgi:hypothetical protein